jgi:hypothetical protein
MIALLHNKVKILINTKKKLKFLFNVEGQNNFNYDLNMMVIQIQNNFNYDLNMMVIHINYYFMKHTPIYSISFSTLHNK